VVGRVWQWNPDSNFDKIEGPHGVGGEQENWLAGITRGGARAAGGRGSGFEPWVRGGGKRKRSKEPQIRRPTFWPPSSGWKEKKFQ